MWGRGAALGWLRSDASAVPVLVRLFIQALSCRLPIRPPSSVSACYSFGDAAAEDRRKTQYFEIFGNSGIYHVVWFAGTTPFRLPWSCVGTDMDVLTIRWELYNIN